MPLQNYGAENALPTMPVMSSHTDDQAKNLAALSALSDRLESICHRISGPKPQAVSRESERAGVNSLTTRLSEQNEKFTNLLLAIEASVHQIETFV